MPQKKKTSTKKKKRAANNQGNALQARTANAARTPFTTRTLHSSNNSNRQEGLSHLKVDLSKLWKDLEARHEYYKSAYCRYKEATARFIKFMQESCPESVYKDKEDETFKVNDMATIADWMERNQFPIPKTTKRDLALAIRIRSRTANSIFGGGDSGHKHFLLQLQYCRIVLNRLPEVESVSNVRAAAGGSEKPQDAANYQRNRYEILMDEFEGEDITESDDTEVFPQTVQLHSKAEHKPLTLTELLESDDRNDAILFLMELDKLMEHVSEQYSVLKDVFLRDESVGLGGSTIIETWLEATVSTNMAIQQVKHLEMDLMTQHPHLSTPYRLLATLVLPEVTQTVSEIMRQRSTSQCKEKDVSIFLGDSLECCFRNKSDTFNRQDNIAHTFGAEWGVDEKGLKELEEIVSAIQAIVAAEVPIGSEITSFGAFRRNVERSLRLSYPSHSWIKDMPFIGEDRAIHHTLRLLQTFGQVVNETPMNRTIEPVSGFFGAMRKTGQVKRIRDLDELLMTEVLPQLITMNRHGILQYAIPMKDELCPLFVLLNSYAANAEKPVSWSFTFAIHALLTGILEADKIANKLLHIGQNTFDHYFKSVNKSRETIEKEPNAVRSDSWTQNMSAVLLLENLGRPVFGEWALWNPLCGGTILTYLAYFGNLEAGLALVDSVQLRIVLHLFHALLSVGLLRKGEIPLLDYLYDGLKSSKGLWEGELPKRGEFTRRFWICHGCSYSGARDYAREAQEAAQGIASRPKTNTVKGRGRRMTPIDASDVSKSFRRICKRDFSDVVDKYHTPEQRRKMSGTERYRYAVRKNDTLDAIDDEQGLLSFIMPTVGILLEHCVCSLGRALQWDEFLSQGLRLVDYSESTRRAKRDGFIMLFAQYVLGTLDFASDPSSHKFMGVQVGEVCPLFLKQFMGAIDPRSVKWFVPIEYEDKPK